MPEANRFNFNPGKVFKVFDFLLPFLRTPAFRKSLKGGLGIGSGFGIGATLENNEKRANKKDMNKAEIVFKKLAKINLTKEIGTTLPFGFGGGAAQLAHEHDKNYLAESTAAGGALTGGIAGYEVKKKIPKLDFGKKKKLLTMAKDIGGSKFIRKSPLIAAGIGAAAAAGTYGVGAGINKLIRKDK